MLRKQFGAKRTGELFIERGVLTTEQLDRALSHQKEHGGRLGQVIIHLGFRGQVEIEKEIAFALTVQFGVPYLSLEQYEVDQRVVQLIPETIARQYLVIAVDQVGGALSVAMADPGLAGATEEIEAYTQCSVQPCISTPSEISQAIERHYKAGGGRTSKSEKRKTRGGTGRANGQGKSNGNGDNTKAGNGQRASLQARVITLLVDNNLLTRAQLDQAMQHQRKGQRSLLNTLVAEKTVKEADVLSAVSQGLGIPLISLSRVKISPELRPLIPKELARHEQLIPVSRTGQTVTVAMTDPLNVFALDTLKALTGLTIHPVLTTAKELRDALDAFYGAGVKETVEEIVQEQTSAEQELDIFETGVEQMDANRLLQLSRAAPVVRLTDALLTKAVALRASDLLIEPGERTMNIRYRIDGVLRDADAPPKQFQQAVVSRIKIMAELNIAERRLPQDGHFKFSTEDRDIDFRISVLPSVFGEKVAVRVLDKSYISLDLHQLGFASVDLERLAACAQQPHGMILATGPTGSGKTTTLYSLLKLIDHPEKNLVTVEDPVELKLAGINQVSSKAEIGLTFARALRSILRQDPDVIMVGEIRDAETADMAVKSSLTGHLVLSTLHTNSAIGAIARLLNMGVEPFLLNSCLLAVIGQRLIRKLCPHCQEAYTPPRGLAEKLGLLGPKGELPQLVRAAGCEGCAKTGYAGRELIAEVFVLTPEIRALISERAGARELEEAAARAGMRSLREHGLEKVLANMTSLDEIFRTTIGELIEE